MQNTIPLSVYIHIPWCVKKCPYCDFNSHALRGELPESAYIDQLINELQQKMEWIQGRTIETIFIGGGTPSLFSAQSYERLLGYIRNQTHLSPTAEITIEANPGTVEHHRFSDYCKIGINRLSLGIQSFSDHQLKQLGRIHDRTQALHAIDQAKQAGFSNFNLDLMFGLSEQTTEEALDDLQVAIAAQPTHLSWYQLTLEPQTLFHKFPPPLPDDDALWDMYQAGRVCLEGHGYHSYEISAYSQPGRQCEHNLNYWRFGDYLGMGAGAHSKITRINTLASQTVTRHANIKHPALYLKSKNFISEIQTITAQDLPLEFMLNALRLAEPIPLALFTARTGLDAISLQKALHKAVAQGLIEWNNHIITVTTQGKCYLNNLLELFCVDL